MSIKIMGDDRPLFSSAIFLAPADYSVRSVTSSK
jgi:hypothetical protein